MESVIVLLVLIIAVMIVSRAIDKRKENALKAEKEKQSREILEKNPELAKMILGQNSQKQDLKLENVVDNDEKTENVE